MSRAVLTLDTERLFLRPFRDDDIDAYAAMCADPDVMRYIGGRSVLSRDEAWRQMAMFVGHWQLLLSLPSPVLRFTVIQ